MNHEQFAKFLIDEGLTPGEDFSLSDDGNIMMSEKAVNYLKSKLEPEDQEHFKSLFETRKENPWLKIESRLGAPFFSNLKEIAAGRIKQLTDKEALHYVFHILEGFKKKHPQIGDDFSSWLIAEAVGYKRWDSIQAFINQSDDDENLNIEESNPYFGIWMNDLISACGGGHYITKDEKGEDIIHEKGMALLEEVFRGNQD